MRVLLSLIVLAAVALAGCQPTEVTSEPAPTDDQEQAADVGDAITLSGTDESLRVKVTLADVHDPATATSDMLAPDDGYHYVAADLRLEVVGEADYGDSPSNGATLIDSDDAGHDAESASPDVAECDSLGGDVTIPAGGTRTGCVVFQVPDGRQARAVQFALNSGFAPQTGMWRLGGGSS